MIQVNRSIMVCRPAKEIKLCPHWVCLCNLLGLVGNRQYGGYYSTLCRSFVQPIWVMMVAVVSSTHDLHNGHRPSVRVGSANLRSCSMQMQNRICLNIIVSFFPTITTCPGSKYSVLTLLHVLYRLASLVGLLQFYLVVL